MKPEPAARIVTGARQKLLLIGFGLVLCVLLLALAEGLLALLGWGDAHRWDDPFVGFVAGSDLFSRRRLADGDEVYVTNPEKLAFFNHQQFPVARDRDTCRALGGSTTAGRPYDAAVAFPRWLERYLEAAPDRDRRFEVINAGAISYASYRIVVLMRELVRYEPDFFVLYTGHNEFLEERSYADVRRQHPLLQRLRIRVGGLRLFALARSVRGAPAGDALPAEVDAKLDGWTGVDLYHRDPTLQRAVIDHFEYNLRQIVTIARRHGAGLLLVKPVANLRDFSPFKSEHRPGLDAAARRRFDALLLEGRRHLADGRPEAALESLGAARAIDSEYAELHFRIGRGHLALGNQDAARDAFVAARDLDVAPLRATTPILERLETVAAEYDLPVVDLPAILEGGILGNEYLLDHVHPDISVHSLVAERLVEQLVAQRVLAAPPPAAERRAIYDRVLAGLDPAYYGQRDLNLAKVLGWSGKLAEAEPPLRRAVETLPDHPEVHLNLGIVCQRSGRHEEAVTHLSRAIALDPEVAAAHFNLGVVLGRLGRSTAAARALERAIELRPDYPEAHYNLGSVLLAEDAVDEAARVLERARALRPESPEVGVRLAVTYARQGRLEDAADELDRIVRERPDHAEAHYNRGVVAAQRGRREDAVAAWRRTLEVDPDHARALNNMAIADAGAGRLEDAERALLRAVASEPAYAEAYLNLAVVYDQTGRPQAAIEALVRALALEPENRRFHQALGALYLATGKEELGRSHLALAEGRPR
jgi:tetratricopeptide (TPR) repeat protein